MCGISAIVQSRPARSGGRVLRAMTGLVEHRGPDGAGFAFLRPDSGGYRAVDESSPWRVGLGFRRLAILDLSAAADQPMARPLGGPALDRSDTAPLWMVYNGEIYNYLELRAELEALGQRFRSTGDSEVLLAAYESWGVDCFRKLRGMWGLVLVDAQRQEIVVSRDRLGIKPLYIAVGASELVFCSEIKQLTAVPGVRLSADLEAVSDYLLSGYEETDRTFFSGVEALPPGTWRRYRLSDLAVAGEGTFWQPEAIEATIGDPDRAGERLGEALEESVRLHLRSDIPIAVSLSGGLDSATLATLLATELERTQPSDAEPLHTFTASFPGDPLDESRYVGRLTDDWTAERHFVTPDPEELLEDLDRFVWQHDEPVGSLSQYAAYRIAREAAENGIHVTLNGQGGDEILGGYWQSYFTYLRRLLVSGRWLSLGGQLLGAAAPGGNREALRQPLFLLRRYRQRRGAGRRTARRVDRILAMDPQERRVYEIRQLFLPRLLRWDDRNLMGFSVEGRYPFLDHRVVELALRFRPQALYRAGWTKLPLRRAMGGRLPAEIVWRRDKQGFETPQEAWCRGGLAPLLAGLVAGRSPVWSLVERDQMAPAADTPEPHQALLRALLVDRWMKRFDVEIEEAA